ncbi:putative methyltransferase-domain-containing protein [Tuber brumale]|nr:putative methyltransferase-domain-containing protein [Tuber brumale]
MLTNTIEELDPRSESDPAAVFEDSLSTIFSDPRVQHGEPGKYVLYKSEELGDFKLRLADPDPSNHSLFSHFVWNAALQAAELITTAEFNVARKKVLEVGAGAGLPGIIAVYCDAEETVLSDYPATEFLSNIQTNLEINLSKSQLKRASVVGHEWGQTYDKLCTTRAGAFDKIIAADCFWMESQHENLAKSVKTLLARDGELLAIAGFHTGRDKVAGFFDAAERVGLARVKITEKDVEGVEREWVRDRGQEDPVERKRWLAIGVFKHSDL